MAGGGAPKRRQAPVTYDIRVVAPRPLSVYPAMAKRWVPSVARFGAFLGIGFLYFTDWQIFMKHLPLYGGKFEPKEPLT